MTPDDHIIAVQEAHRRSLEARAILNAERAQAIRRAMDGGVGATELARALGVSRQRIYEMIRQDNP